MEGILKLHVQAAISYILLYIKFKNYLWSSKKIGVDVLNDIIKNQRAT